MGSHRAGGAEKCEKSVGEIQEEYLAFPLTFEILNSRFEDFGDFVGHEGVFGFDNRTPDWIWELSRTREKKLELEDEPFEFSKGAQIGCCLKSRRRLRKEQLFEKGNGEIRVNAPQEKKGSGRIAEKDVAEGTVFEVLSGKWGENH
jgi:hypothetical protein